MSVEQMARSLRRHDPPVMGMLADDWLALDVRTVRDDEMRDCPGLREFAGNLLLRSGVESRYEAPHGRRGRAY